MRIGRTIGSVTLVNSHPAMRGGILRLVVPLRQQDLDAEDGPAEPLSPYGISKLAAERLTHLMGRHGGVQTMALRLFNTFGAGQQFTPYVGVITIFIHRILAGQPVTIFGFW